MYIAAATKGQGKGDRPARELPEAASAHAGGEGRRRRAFHARQHPHVSRLRVPDRARASCSTSCRAACTWPFMFTLFWRRADARKPTNPGAPPGPPMTAKHGPPFNTGWTIFYTRRLYKRIEDCWNRPIAGQAATFIDVLLRKRGARRRAPHELTGETKNCLNLGSYNYLGFGGYDPICTKAVIRTLREHGVTACSSRMEAGSTPVHAQLESTVATFLEKEAAIVIGMGFATNSAVIPVVVDPEGNGKGVLLISDALNHSSIVEGVRGSGAKVQPFAHNNMGHLEAILRRATEDGQPSGVPWRKIVIVVEGIYSMEGEFARLREIVALKKKYNATCTSTRRTRSARSARAAAASPTTSASPPRTSTS